MSSTYWGNPSHRLHLCREGVTITWGNPSDPATFPAGKFDIVYDNNGKDMEACKPLIDTYKVRVGPLLSL